MGAASRFVWALQTGAGPRAGAERSGAGWARAWSLAGWAVSAWAGDSALPPCVAAVVRELLLLVTGIWPRAVVAAAPAQARGQV